MARSPSLVVRYIIQQLFVTDMVLNTTQRLLRFGEFELDLQNQELRRNGVASKLNPQPLKVLSLLASRAGQVVTREELQQEIWGAETYVDFDHGLNQCIKQIRTVLNDSIDQPVFVETVPKRGYRFLAPVVSKIAQAPGPKITESTSGPDLPRAKQLIAARHGLGSKVRPISIAMFGAGVLFAVLAGGFFYSRQLGRTLPPLQNTKIERLTSLGNVVVTAISPDGKYVAYAVKESAGQQSLRLRHMATRSDTQIRPPTTLLYFHLAFSPDSDYLYFVGSQPDKPSLGTLYRIPVLGGGQRKLITDVDSGVSFSPDGEKIAFVRDDPAAATSKIVITNADGGTERVLSTMVGRYYIDVAWSPAGKWIAAINTDSSTGSQNKVTLIDMSGKGQRTVCTRRSKNRPHHAAHAA
jgi:DNA-binding winged helix-turn-helix (wHTH) protein